MTTAELKANLQHFQLSHLIRAHSAAGNSSDRVTRVNDAAFELDPSVEIVGSLCEPLAYTNVCVTCGLNILNFIDTETGKIVKRFVDDGYVNKTKEVFYRVAWTVLNGSSVLVAGGEHGQLKIILPKYSSLIARVDAHSRPIRCLIFDYKYKNVLFTGSDDHTIKIWKIDIVEGQSELECECSCVLLGSIEYNNQSSSGGKIKPDQVLSMCFVPDRYMLVAAESGTYSVKVNVRKMLKSNEQKKPGTNTNALEKQDENLTNEKALDFMTSTKPDDSKLNNPQLVAQPVVIEAVSRKQQVVVEKKFTSNSLIFANDLLYANEIGAAHVHCVELEIDEDSIRLKLVESLTISDEAFAADSRTTCLIENGLTMMLKSNSEGRLSCGKLDSSGRKLNLVLNYELPSDYTIKPAGMTAARTEIKSYDLFERPRVLVAVSSAHSIVAVTDQNIIGVFKRFRDDDKLILNH